MKIVSKKDVLILARPDHSYGIYEVLLRQDNIKYLYCSFKLLPIWLKRFVKNSRARFYSECYSNCILQSILHVYRVRRNKYKLEKYEKVAFEFHLKHLLPFLRPSIIHYWPYYSYKAIGKYKKKHPEVKTFAEVYFPCENWVIDNIKPLYERIGVDVYTGKIERDAGKLKELMEFEDNFLVPSEFVADTYRKYYPNKNYIIIPYGIQKWDGYKKKEAVKDGSSIRRFVFCGGGISIEKGCDLMFDYFTKHQDVELHVYGSFSPDQKEYFEQIQYTTNIHFHGFVAKSLLQEEISQYDAGIHLSRYDAYSLSVSEMTGAGLPVIVSDKTGNFFHLQEIGAGVVTKLDMADINEGVQQIRTPEQYNRMLDNIDKYLKSNPKPYGERVVEFYQSELYGQ